MAQKFRFLFFDMCLVIGTLGFGRCNCLFDIPAPGIGRDRRKKCK